ncbi:MAG: glycosyltransferase family 4 protein [Patescibacteria group bacterium]
MRILVDARGLLEETKAGVEGYTYNMLDNLQRMYPKDEYILFSYSRTRSPESELANKWQWKHFRWSNLLVSASFRMLRYPVVDKILGDFDWVWFPNIRFFPVSRRIKKIVTVHDLSFDIMPDCYSNKRRLWHWYMNIKKNLLAAQKVVCVSENTRQDLLERYHIEREKVFTIYPGIEREKFCGPKKGKKSKYIIFLGTLEERKNILTLLKAYEYYSLRLTDHPLKLVLIGSNCLTWNIKEYLRERNIQNRVIMCGYLNDEDRNRILSESAVVVYPSYYEGFGFPPLEAIAMGIPSLSSFCGSLGEVLDDKCMLLDPLDYKTLAVNISQILDSDLEGQNNDLSDFFQRYDWEKSAYFFREILDR